MRTIVTRILCGMLALSGMSGCERKCLAGLMLKDGVCVHANGATDNSLDASAEHTSSTDPDQSSIIGTDSKTGSSANGAGSGGSANASVTSMSGAMNMSSLPATPAGGAAAAAPGQGGASAPPANNPASAPMTTPQVDAGNDCQPTQELCDAIDNDCDEQTDEEVDPEPCGGPTAGTGECKAGTRNCQGGGWSECSGEVQPTQEVCDDRMLDEDCDGRIDNGCACTTGDMRPCQTPPSCMAGVQACDNGVWGSECIGEVRGEREICDGEDNDCDGRVDNGSLCASGQKCAGADGCVECTADTECRGNADECNELYCDTRSHRCATRQVTGACTVNGRAGTCTSGNCYECSSVADCTRSTTADDCHKVECVNHSCRQSVNAGALCGDQMVCSGSGVCQKSCGNGVVDRSAGEDCDDNTALCVGCKSAAGYYSTCGAGRRACAADAACWTNPALSSPEVCFPTCSASGACDTKGRGRGVCVGGVCLIVCGHCEVNPVQCTKSGTVCPSGLNCEEGPPDMYCW